MRPKFSIVCLIGFCTILLGADTIDRHYASDVTRHDDVLNKDFKWRTLSNNPQEELPPTFFDQLKANQAANEKKLAELAAEANQKRRGEGAAAQQATKLEPSLVPPVLYIRDGWMYVVGETPNVGTEWVRASATGTRMVVTVTDKNLPTERHRIYFRQTGAGSGHARDRVNIFDPQGQLLASLEEYQYATFIKNAGGNVVLAPGSPSFEPPNGVITDDDNVALAETRAAKFGLPPQ